MTFHHATLPCTAFQQSCSLVWDGETKQAALFDPGSDIPRLLAELQRCGQALEQIWLTHAHIDHAGATGELARTLGLPIAGPHEGDRFWIDALPEQGRMFGFPPAEPFEPTRWLHDGATVRIGGCELQVRHCPGHTPGHVVFFEPIAKHAFVGDVLFAGGVGRTDFPKGDFDTLVRSITGRLWPLGDDVRFTPGHGPQSTFGQERRTNPFVGGT